jgi:hypothetical protein
VVGGIWHGACSMNARFCDGMIEGEENRPPCSRSGSDVGGRGGGGFLNSLRAPLAHSRFVSGHRKNRTPVAECVTIIVLSL